MGPAWSLGTGSFNSGSGNPEVQPNGELNRPYPTLPVDELNRKFFTKCGLVEDRTRNKTQFLLRLLYIKPYFWLPISHGQQGPCEEAWVQDVVPWGEASPSLRWAQKMIWSVWELPPMHTATAPLPKLSFPRAFTPSSLLSCSPDLCQVS